MDLSNECYNQKISDSHLVAISTIHCAKWRLLPPDLGLENIVKEDIDRQTGSETEKRHNFFTEWKQQKGASATYSALITALQKIGCQSDAEYVFKLVRPLSPASRPTCSSTQAETKNGVTESSAASTQTETDSTEAKNGVTGTSSTGPSSNTVGMM